MTRLSRAIVPWSRQPRGAWVALAMLATVGCGSPSTGPSPPVTIDRPATLVGAGDIGLCGSPGTAATAMLLDDLPGPVFTAGDNVYYTGSEQEFRDCYAPFWGRHRARTRPVPGNHDYETAGAAPYYAYFGPLAGEAGRGYYRYTAGSWLILALNSEVDHGPGSAQMQWLRGELASFQGACAAAIWHRPLFTSGPNRDNPDMLDVWRTLYEFNVDVVINGHDHIYERFAPQDPDGRFDLIRGIRQFTVGTGGVTLYQVASVHANSEQRASVWGVMALTLYGGGYQWQFIPVAGESFSDAGAGSCH